VIVVVVSVIMNEMPIDISATATLKARVAGDPAAMISSSCSCTVHVFSLPSGATRTGDICCPVVVGFFAMLLDRFLTALLDTHPRLHRACIAAQVNDEVPVPAPGGSRRTGVFSASPP
jgi:hypothetical protein